MIGRQWLEVLEALAQAQEANARATRLVLMYELGHPPNIVRDADKTGPRMPYKGEVALENLKRVFDEDRSQTERMRVRKIAEKLAEQRLITDADAKTFDPKR